MKILTIQAATIKTIAQVALVKMKQVLYGLLLRIAKIIVKIKRISGINTNITPRTIKAKFSLISSSVGKTILSSPL